MLTGAVSEVQRHDMLDQNCSSHNFSRETPSTIMISCDDMFNYTSTFEDMKDGEKYTIYIQRNRSLSM